jgi:hypothetical protein
MTDNKKIILDHAIQELQKIMTDLKNGKTPVFPKSLKKLADIISISDDEINKSKLKEEDINDMLNNIAKNITEKK